MRSDRVSRIGYARRAMHTLSCRFVSWAVTVATLFLAVPLLRSQIPDWPKTTPPEVAAAGLNVQLTGADYGNGVFVLAGSFSVGTTVQALTPAVYTSPDGTTWTRRTLPVTSGSTGTPRFVNGKFLLGVNASQGGSGVILSSADGIAWTSSAVIDRNLNAPHAFAYGNGVYVASAPGSIVLPFQFITSSDGIVWTPRIVTAAAGSSTNYLTFFNGKFYATFFGGNGAGLYSSTDGIAWSRLNSTYTGLIASSPTTLLVSYFAPATTSPIQAVSADGLAFSPATPGISQLSGNINYLNGAFVTPAPAGPGAFDATLVRASTDGRSWTTIATAANQFGASEIAFGGGRYVFVGEFDVFSGTTTGGSGGGSAGGGGSTPPAIVAQPATQAASIGGSVTFSVTATGTGFTYQWLFNGIAINGAINATYTLATVTAANAGSYAVRITGNGGTTTSNAATLTVVPGSPGGGYLSNLSIRSNAGAGAQTLIVGVSVGGANTNGTKNLLIRGIGPALTGFGVVGALADPRIEAFAGQTSIASNDNWDATQTPLAVQASVGAFALAPGSKDAALLGAGIPAGSYSVQVTGVGGTTGIALAEIYDLTPAAAFSATTPRLVNISARTQVGTGGDILITGFNIGGAGTRRLLIRAVGPTLGGFGVTGALSDPKLDVISGSTVIASNDNWDATATPAATQTGAGAFALATGSKDAVLIVSLAPGSYTAQVSGVGGTTGVALVEIYELP